MSKYIDSGTEPKVCSLCGEEIPDDASYYLDKGGSREYCEDCNRFLVERIIKDRERGKLAKRARYEYTPRGAPNIPDRECANCGTVFTPATGNGLYCSAECREAHYERIRYERGRFVIFERDGFRCIYCGRTSVKDGVVLHVDHIIPKLSGGADEAGNLVTACEDCNLEKAAGIIEGVEWILREVAFRNRVFEINPHLTIKFNL